METWTTRSCPDETCPNCKTIYQVTVTQFPLKDEGAFKCEKCATLIKSWNDTRFWDFKLKRTTPRKKTPTTS